MPSMCGNDQKLFGIGFPKTGTTSLEIAAEIIGYKVCRGYLNSGHTNYLIALYVHGDFEEIIAITRYFNAFFDLPWGGGTLYKTLYEHYPDAHYLLSVRDEQDWYRSLENMLMQFGSDKDSALDHIHKRGAYGASYFFRKYLKLDSLKNNRQTLIDLYNRHNDSVVEFFNKKNKAILVKDFTQSKDSWVSLCDFLGKDNPDVPFPHRNKGPKINKSV